MKLFPLVEFKGQGRGSKNEEALGALLSRVSITIYQQVLMSFLLPFQRKSKD